MIKFKVFLQILFICLLFTSCNNEPYEDGPFSGEIIIDDDHDDDDDNNNGGDDDNNPAEQALLVSQIRIQRPGNSQVYTTDYIYDSENRLIREEDSDGYILNYDYEDNRLVGTNSSNGIDNSEDILEYYTYDSQGKIDAVTIDIQEVPNPYTIRYNYISDNTVIEGFRTLTGQLEERQSYSLTGNIYLLDEFNSDGTYSEFFVHDDKNGAFKSMAQREAIASINSENLPSSLLRFGLNNPTLREFRVNAILTQSLTFSYTYNDDNYPVSITEVFTNNGVTQTSVYSLTYITAQ
ncbi:hypothetical protein [Winogradskyella sp. PE311]|uniref:hypothetical protein n=1 Tax=Winogradskyella sp. PE311 TaxID=3366943 RepID=UPI003980349E